MHQVCTALLGLHFIVGNECFVTSSFVLFVERVACRSVLPTPPPSFMYWLWANIAPLELLRRIGVAVAPELLICLPSLLLSERIH